MYLKKRLFIYYYYIVGPFVSPNNNIRYL